MKHEALLLLNLKKMLNLSSSTVMIGKINSSHTGQYFKLLLLSADLYQNQLFQKDLSGVLSECQRVFCWS